jgi:hypothetical protein
MPLIFIEPTRRGAVEDAVFARAAEIQDAIKNRIMAALNYPSSDVLVSIRACTIAVADPELVDYLVTIDVCPGEKVETLSGELCQSVARILAIQGLDRGGIEVWGPRPLPGPWAGIRNGKFYDVVNHPKSEVQMEADLK